MSQADITYMGLPPGSYTLCVRVLNDDGTMEEEVSELDIEILSPWYRSWWAWILYMLLIGILLFGRHWLARLFSGFFKRGPRGEKCEDKQPAASEKDEEIEEAILMDEK